MMAAAPPNNAATVDGLLLIGLRDRETRAQAAAARARWESEGEPSASTPQLDTGPAG